MANEMRGLERSTVTSVSWFRWIGTAAVLGALVACSSSLGPGGAGGAGGTACTAAAAGGGGTNGFAALSGTTGTAATGGSGAGGWCGNSPLPTAEPFSCQPTYAQQLATVCMFGAPSWKGAGSCQSFQVTSLSTGFYEIFCAYDTAGALVEALRCEDSDVYCSQPCIKSANARADLTSCRSLPSVCGDCT